MGTYIPHTDDEVEDMLTFLGLASLDELFAVVPEALRLQRGLELADGVGEPDVLARFEGYGNANRARSDRLVCFAGGGAYDHEIPSVTRALAGRSEFVTSYTPYQPEVAQGVLQAVFEFQTMVARLAGLPVANASLYDGGSAAVEAVNLATAASGRPGVWVSAGIHPHWRQMLATAATGTGHRISTVPLVDGITAWPDGTGRTTPRGGPGRLPQLPRVPRGPGRRPPALQSDRSPARGRGGPGVVGPPAFTGSVGGRRRGGGGPGLRHRARASGGPTSGCSPVPRLTCGACRGGWWGRRWTWRAVGPT